MAVTKREHLRIKTRNIAASILLKRLTIVLLLVSLSAGFCLDLQAQSVIYSNGAGGGNWLQSSSWQGGTVPSSNDTAIIISGDSIFLGSDESVGGLSISAGAILYNNGSRIDIDGRYFVDGRHSGPATGDIRLNSNNELIEGTGTIDIGGEIEVQGSNTHVIAAGTSLNISTSALRLTGSSVLLNEGDVYIHDPIDIGSSATLENGATGRLFITSFTGNGALEASTAGNEIIYNEGSASIFVPSSSYYDLTIAGTGVKTLGDDLHLDGSLTLQSALLDVTVASFPIYIKGDWNDAGGAFNYQMGTIHFITDNVQMINSQGGLPFYDVVVDGNGVTKLGSDITIDNNLSIVDGTLDADTSNYTITLLGNWENDEVFIPREGTVDFAGSSLQSIDGQTNWFNVEVNNAADVEIASGRQSLYGALTVNVAAFQTNDLLILASDGVNTGRIAELVTGTVSGEITMERFIPNAPLNWRLFSSPVEGAELMDLTSSFVTTGYAGSDYPNWPNAANPWVSVYANDGPLFAPVDSSGLDLTSGKGIMAYCGSASGISSLLIDVTGEPRMGTQNIPITYQATGNVMTEGWYLTGNPMPSPIDWTLTDHNGIQDNYWIYHPESGNVECWNPLSGNVFGLADGNLASSQGFWVKSTGGTSLVVEEADKVDGSSPIFRSAATGTRLEVSLTTLATTYHDKAVLYFDSAATENYDAMDAYKFYFSHWDAPVLSAVLPNGTDVMLNSLPTDEDLVVPLRARVPVTGIYTISVGGLDEVNNACIILEDRYTGVYTDLLTDSFYSVTMFDTTAIPRFYLHYNTADRVETTLPTCAGDEDGVAIANGAGVGPWDYVWTDLSGTVLQSQTSVNGSNTITDLSAGTYIVTIVDSTGFCAAVSDTFIMIDPAPVVAQFVHTDTVYLNQGGVASFTNNSTGATDYLWDFGDGTAQSTDISPTHTYTTLGSYQTMLIASSTPCEDTTYGYVRVLMDVGVEELLEGGQATVFVAGENLVVLLDFDQTEQVQVSLLNLLGEEVITPQQVVGAKGRFELPLDGSIAHGVYLVRMQWSSGEVTRKITY